MKKIIFFVFFYFIFNIESNSKNLENFKPIQKIDFHINKNFDSSYKSLKNYLTSNCSINFGYDKKLNKFGYINSTFSEYEIIDFLMRSNTFSLISCKNVIIDNIKISKFSFGTCNGKINEINISVFSPGRLNNNLLEEWIFYFTGFSTNKPKSNMTTRTAAINGKDVVFIKNSSTWSGKNDQQILTVIYTYVETEKESNIVYGNRVDFTQLKKC